MAYHYTIRPWISMLFASKILTSPWQSLLEAFHHRSDKNKY
ncbi:hypothetical protein GcM3_118022 [Golovinomyces cichoracearum]|uniref:Uncharacterized protein n=1 Tax=Golovinomyces cichoracearum TaxID=62708 RepID=A0A420I7J7_9PEZI|nr:hypothetical protein GcM3_118022 [Golovinomyces cichoracearum]